MQKLKLLLFFFKAVGLWLLVFFFGRILFVLFNNTGLSFNQIAPVFYEGILLDISTACYLVLIPLLLYAWNEFRPSVINKKILQVYMTIAISFVIITEISGMFLYREWGNTLNYRAIRYLLYPSEATASLEWKTIIIAATAILFLVLIWRFLFRKALVLPQDNTDKKWPAVLAVCIIPLLFIGIRGGFRQISLSESNAYFSENNFLNQAALNKSWYFLRNVLNNVQKKKPFYFYPAFDQPQLHAELYPEARPVKWLTHEKPNIVIIILEGWSSDVIPSLGGMSGVTPGFDSLTKNGLFFTNMYASGTRTDQGVISLLSGFPALPDLSIVQDVEKSVKLPSLMKDLKHAGYYTSLIYGGELEFCNFKTYFVAQGTDKLIDKYSFKKSERTITWGVPDHIMLQRANAELTGVKEPFFSVILTQSSHQPYDSPSNCKVTASDADKYKATVTYMDNAISTFMSNCRNQSWYNNTLFVFVSDHGNKLPLKRDYNDHERFHIPMLFYGNVLDTALRGTQNSATANHNDLPATLLSQLSLPHQSYHFSKDFLADTVVPFAYWSTDNTMGWITGHQKAGINLHTTEVFSRDNEHPGNEQQNGLGYIQEVLKEYENY